MRSNELIEDVELKEEQVDSLSVEFSEEGIAESIEIEDEIELEYYDALPPFEKLKMVSKKIGVKVMDRPDYNCKLCNGTGVIGYTPVKGSKIGLPIACTCVPIRQDVGNVVAPKLNREQRRRMAKMSRKK